MDAFDTVMHELAKSGIAARADICGKDCTSFKIGGRISVFCEPKNINELASAIGIAESAGCRFFVIGNGSNLLIPDEGIEAVLIRPAGELTESRIEGRTLFAGAGASLAAAAKASVAAGLMGLEWAGGIPGTIGGAVAMNAGAYGGEIKDVIKKVTVLKDGLVSAADVAPGDMGYRSSRFSFPDCVVLSAEFELQPDDGGAAARIREYNKKRREKQPVELPSAGSAFKRPEG